MKRIPFISWLVIGFKAIISDIKSYYRRVLRNEAEKNLSRTQAYWKIKDIFCSVLLMNLEAFTL